MTLREFMDYLVLNGQARYDNATQCWIFERKGHVLVEEIDALDQTEQAQLEAVVEAARELRLLMLAPHKFIEQRVQAIAVFDNALAALEQPEKTS